MEIESTPLQDPGSGEIQVQVKACGINFADISVRLGLYAAAKNLYPLCPGLEFSGMVAQTGPGVEEFQPGDRVFGVSRFGAYSTVVNTVSDHLWHLPENWDFSRGAAFPVAYLTAYYALHHVGHLHPDDRVLVHSAAGGVGTALLHLLRANGNLSAGVVGRHEKVPYAREAGASLVIDKEKQQLWEAAEQWSPEGYDLILDANGASTLKASYNHLTPGGRLLIYGFASMFSPTGKKNYLKLMWYYFKTPRFNPFHLTGTNRTVSGFNLIYLFDKKTFFREIMERLLRLDRENKLPEMPLKSYPFEEVAAAHKALESGKTVGKLVLLT
ncbi:MAG: zinc-binding dehydrogenase [Deltaproteobacteria bacterium]|nr:MAG: zinc-binding dehydrogenase [Deltaproteobacteria bacterium]